MENQYWLVGAKFGGISDALPMFIKRGYWFCWSSGESENESSHTGNSVRAQQNRFRKIKIGDRIAVKKLLGKGSPNIGIRAIGTVKDIDFDEWRVYVDWHLTEIENRIVHLKGCTASIHGPFQYNDPWVQSIFCL